MVLTDTYSVPFNAGFPHGQSLDFVVLVFSDLGQRDIPSLAGRNQSAGESVRFV